MKLIDSVFLIDDEPISNLISEKIIRRFHPSSSINSFLSAESALEYLNNTHKDLAAHVFPQLIMVDLRMPGMSGLEFLNVLAKLPDYKINRTQVFALSSSTDPKECEQALDHPVCSGLIEKPLTLEKLAGILNLAKGII